MLKLKRCSAIVVAATAGCFAVTMCFGLIRASASTAMPVSGDVGKLPHSNSVRALPVVTAGIAIPADEALQVATREFNVASTELDSDAGIVRASLTLGAGGSYSNRDTWVISVNRDTPSPTGKVVFHKLCIAIDAQTGKYLFAYTADAA